MDCKVVLILHIGHNASPPFASHGLLLLGSSLFHPFLLRTTRSYRFRYLFVLGFSREFPHRLISSSSCMT